MVQRNSHIGRPIARINIDIFFFAMRNFVMAKMFEILQGVIKVSSSKKIRILSRFARVWVLARKHLQL